MEPLSWRGLSAVLLAIFSITVGFGIVLPILPFAVERVTAGTDVASQSRHVGLLTGTYVFAIFLFAPQWGKLSDQQGRRPIILIGLTGFAASAVLFSLVESFPLLYLGRLLDGLFAAAITPAAYALVGDRAQSMEWRAQRFVLISVTGTAGIFVGPLLGGVALEGARGLSQQLATSSASSEAIEGAKRLFDPAALTLGSARRFAIYKRPNLLLHDPARLLRLLANPERPVQLILAGKAHPADRAGQALIREWTNFIRRPEVSPHVIFLSDYDMPLTEHLVQGVDVWINTPRRPWEACGTSGMKVLVNGGINLSELDGWWAEAYAPEVGWALGDGHEHGDDPDWDAAEAEALYDLLEREKIPEFYTRDEKISPAPGWRGCGKVWRG